MRQFEYYHDSENRWRLSSLNTTFEAEPNEEEYPGAQLGDSTPTNYPLQTDWPYQCAIYDEIPDQPSTVDSGATEMIQPL